MLRVFLPLIGLQDIRVFGYAANVTEIQRVFAGGSGESLRERKMSIHGTTARTGEHAKLDGLKPSRL